MIGSTLLRQGSYITKVIEAKQEMMCKISKKPIEHQTNTM